MATAGTKVRVEDEWLDLAVPAGGTAGQLLAKASGTDYDSEWVDPEVLGGGIVSVNGETGPAVTLDADDVGAAAAAHNHDADYLSLDGGEIVGTVRIRDAGNTKSYRLRTSGGNLDLDAAGAKLVFSVFTNPDLTGTQRTYLVLENGASIAQAVGMWQWRVGPDGAETARIDGTNGSADFTGRVEVGSHALDPATGVAELGSKNSLSQMRLAGFKGTSGAPTTGTWATGDVVLDTAGAWHLCTAGGTPGTWLSPLAGRMLAYYWDGDSYVLATDAAHYVGPTDPGAVPDGSVWDDTSA